MNNQDTQCIMQKNIGIYCLDKSNCDKCGWNPKVAEQRKKERKYKALKECRFCIHYDMCLKDMCMKADCKYYIRSVKNTDYHYDLSEIR